MKKALSVLLLLLVCASAFGQQGFRDQHGQVSPNTDSRKSIDGFAGWLVVTPDADWKAKWETPADTVPYFATASSTTRGKQLFVLIFFANPKLDGSNAADIRCDIDVLKPDGKPSFHQTGMTCFKGALHEPATHMFLSAPVIVWTGDATDHSGTWVVQVTLKDNLRHVTMPLRTSFELK
ncbi:hypothetical protein [Rhodanobacter sp. L36]|uniref:hypothetical protein n=1 Tax=Rhodanobacter sp. L36 TaxID=1747221 RepID=UPI00131A9F00|nr:hypothetical protein [Rhodanobacter sp. L36]